MLQGQVLKLMGLLVVYLKIHPIACEWASIHLFRDIAAAKVVGVVRVFPTLFHAVR